MIKKHLRPLRNATRYSLDGIRYLLKERAFVQELLIMPFLIVYLFASEVVSYIKLYIVFSYVLLLITEALNTCVEVIIDRISSDQHELSKKAKDVGSAAVFIAIVHFVGALLYSVISLFA